MCGICGASWTDPERALAPSLIEAMSSRLIHRGPDDAGLYHDPHAALGFRRLSILDLHGAHQPLSNEDGTIWVAFNGEIYNFKELRHRLEAKGHTLRSTGDTEVLVHLYEDEGPDLFQHLRGMFALAIWDAPRRTLVLGRDRLGQKPLLYRVEPGRITFASELKALLALPESILPRRVDPLAIDQYLLFGYVPHPGTILEGVHKLPPAHRAVWKNGRLTIDRYWEPDWSAESSESPEALREQLRALLDDAVREQMVSDVPLGAFLSGGIDSTIIVGLMQRHSNRPVKTFSIGFDDPAFDERPFAEAAARHIGTEHHTFVVQPDQWNTLPALADQFDEPFADSSALPTWHVSEQTRKHVTVALTGDAGDELFAGYDRYRAQFALAQLDWLPPRLRAWLGGPLARRIPRSSKAKTPLRKVRRLLEGIGETSHQRHVRWMTQCEESARVALYSDPFLSNLADRAAADPHRDDPAGVLLRVLNLAPHRDVVTRALIADLLTYLPGDLLFKVDMASMAHSLEARGPFLDHRVVELALKIPITQKLRLRGGRSKVILKDAFPEFLPPALKNRPKMGFSVPLDRWFRGPLKNELRDVLLDPIAQNRGLFRTQEVTRLITEHTQSRRDHATKLWELLMLELWFRHHLDAQPNRNTGDTGTPSPRGVGPA